MRNTFKRVLSFILALTMVLGLGVTAFAVETSTVTFFIELNKGGLLTPDGGDAAMAGATVGSGVLRAINAQPEFTGNGLRETLNEERFEGKYAFLLDYQWDGKYYKDKNCTTEYKATDLVKAGENLVYLNYVDSCTVNFFIEDESFSKPVVLKERDASGENFVMSNIAKIPSYFHADEGYEYKWVDENGTICENGSLIPATTVTLNLFLEEVSQTTYTVTFDADGGVFANDAEKTREVVEGTAIGELPVVTKEGYTFAGWFAAGDTSAWDSTVVVNQNWTLKAKWEEIPAIEYWNIIFDANGGKVDGKDAITVKVVKGEKIGEQLPTAERAGYVFDGWKYAPDNSINIISESVPGADYTAVAAWTIGAYTLTFDNCKDVTGKEPVSVAVTNGEAIVEHYFNHFDVTGYDFAGWCSDKELTTLATIPTGNWNLTGDVTFYAKYTPKTYTVKLYTVVGYEKTITFIGEKEATYGELFDLSEVELEDRIDDYPFVNWMDGSDNVIAAPFTWTYNSINKEFYAIYDETKYFNVTFKYEDGTEEVRAVEDGYVVGELPTVPEKEGYQKGAWVYEGTGTKVKNTDMPAEDRVAVLKYEAIGYQAVFYSWTKTEPIAVKTVTYDMPLKFVLPSLADIMAADGIDWANIGGTSELLDALGDILTKAYRPGYDFLGWEHGGEVYDVNCEGNWRFNDIDEDGNVVFKAAWKPTTYEVTFSANGGAFEDGETEKVVEMTTGELFKGVLDEIGTPVLDGGEDFRGWTVFNPTSKDIYYTADKLAKEEFYFAKDITIKATYGNLITATLVDTNSGIEVPFIKGYEPFNFVGHLIPSLLESVVDFVEGFGVDIRALLRKVISGSVDIDYVLEILMDEYGNVSLTVPENLDDFFDFLVGILNAVFTGNNPMDYGYYRIGFALEPDGEIFFGYDLEKGQLIMNGDPLISEDTKVYLVYEGDIFYTTMVRDGESDYDLAKVGQYTVRLNQEYGDAVPALAMGEPIPFSTGYGVLYDLFFPNTDPGILFDGWIKAPMTGNGILAVSKNTPEQQSKVIAGLNHYKVEYIDIASDFVLDVAGDYPIVEVYMAYPKRAGFEITLDANGGEFGDGLTAHTVPGVLYKDSIVEAVADAEIPVKPGYNFHSWRLNGENIGKTNPLMPNKDIILKASWEEVTTTVRFVDRDGVTPRETRNVTYDDVIESLPTPATLHIVVPANMEFLGWEIGGRMLEVGDTWQVEGDLVIVKPVFDYLHYTLTADATLGLFENGKRVMTFDVQYGDSILDLVDINAPTHYGYEVAKWTWANSGEEIAVSETVTDNTGIKAAWAPKDVDIYYYDEAGKELYAHDTVKFDKVLTFTNKNPEKTGYTFDGWYSEDGVLYAAGSKVDVEDKLVLTAKYTPKQYKLTFDAQGAEWDDNSYITKKVTFDAPIGELPEAHLTKEGYRFDKWSDYDGIVYTADSIWTTDDSMKLYARWIPDDFNLILDPNGGVFKDESLALGSVTYLSAFGTLPTDNDLYKEGYVLKGWVDEFGNTVTADVVNRLPGVRTLTANWKANSKVINKDNKDIIFDLDGGQFNGEFGGDKTYKVTYDKQLDLPVPTKSGYDFAGWEFKGTVKEAYPDKDFKAAPLMAVKGAPEADLYVNGDVWDIDFDSLKLKAHWTPATFTLHFDIKADETFSAKNELIPVVYGATVTGIPEAIPTKVGYDFAGWLCGELNGAQVIDGVTTWTVASDGYLYASWTPATFTITFDAMGGTLTGAATKDVTYGDVIGKLPTATKSGYKFGGWFIKSFDGDYRVTKTDSFEAPRYTGNVTAYAVWNGDSYTITYKTNGGIFTNFPADANTEYVQSVGYGKEFDLVKAEELSKPGYDFLYWSLSNVAGAAKYAYTGSYNEVGNTILYAQWGVKSFKVTLNANHPEKSVTETKAALGIDPGYVTVNYTQPLNAVEVGLPDIEGKVVGGYEATGRWLDAPNGKVFDTTLPYRYNKDITIYAEWKPAEFTVSYRNTVINSTPFVTPDDITVKYLDAIVADQLPELTATGYTFNGWKYPDGSFVEVGGNWFIKEDTVLTADWTQKTYTLKFVCEGETIKPVYKDMHYGDIMVFPADQVKEGYDFDGWYLDGVKFESTTNVPYNYEGDKVVEGRFTGKQYHVTFDAVTNGGECDTTDANFIFGSGVGTLPTATKKGAQFVVWNTQADGEGQDFISDDIWNIASDTVLYATFEDVDYVVTLNYNGGKDAKDGTSRVVTFNYGDNIFAADKFPTMGMKKTGYEFEGWYIDGEKLTANSEYNYEEVKDIVANWTANTYEIHVNPDNGYKTAPYTVYVTYGELPTGIETPENPGYEFKRWVIEGTSNEFDVTANYMTADNTNIEASWTPVTYHIALDYANGDEKGGFDVVFGQKLAGIPATNPKKTGYKFVEWQIAAPTAHNGDPVTADTVWGYAENGELKAIWKAKEFTLTLDPDDGTIVGGQAEWPVTYDAEIGSLPEATKNGYTFEAWVLPDGTEIEDTTVYTYTDNLTAEAKWTANTYKVTLDADGGEFVGLGVGKKEIAVVFGTPITDVAVARPGYKFGGWYTDHKGAGKQYKTLNAGDSATPWDFYAHDVTLYANWNPETFKITLKSNVYTGELVYIDTEKFLQDVTFNVVYDTDITTAQLPNTVYRVGYTFVGWNTKDDGTGDYIKADDKWLVVEDTTLYAIWEKETYDIEFVLDRDNTADPENQFTKFLNKDYTPAAVQDSCEAAGANFSGVNVTFNEKASNIPSPAQMVLKGYTFGGWLAKVKGVEGETELSKNLYDEDWKLDGGISVPVADKVTLTAIWNAKTYTVGYDVVGNLEGKYTETDFLPADGFGTFDVVFDTEIKAEMLAPAPTKAGYIFDGWFIGSHEVVEGELWTWDETDFEGEMLLEAHWTAEQYTITFVEDDGGVIVKGFKPGHKATETVFDHSLDTMVLTYDEPYELPTKATMEGPNTVGYDFWYWFAVRTPDNYSFKNGGKAAPSGDAWKVDLTENTESNGTDTFYARWNAHTNIAISFDYEGEGLVKDVRADEIKDENGDLVKDSPIEDLPTTYDMEILETELPELELKGYNFLGWFTEDEHELGPDGDYKYWRADEPTTIHAHWEPKTFVVGVDFTIDFDEIGDLPLDNTVDFTDGDYSAFEITYDMPIDAGLFPEDPTCVGYDFTSWQYDGEDIYEAGEDAEKIDWTFDLDEVDGTKPIAVEFDAHWVAKEYEVEIDEDDGDLTPDPDDISPVTYGEDIEGLEGEKIGYNFDGLYLEAEPGDHEEECIQIYDEEGNWVAPKDFDPDDYDPFELHAHWIAKEFDIELVAGKGAEVDPDEIHVTYGEPIGKLPNPSKSGCKFLYWVDENGDRIYSTTLYLFDYETNFYAVYRGKNSIILNYRNLAEDEFEVSDDVFFALEVGDEVEEIVEKTTVVIGEQNSAEADPIDNLEEAKRAKETGEVVTVVIGDEVKTGRVAEVNEANGTIEIDEVTEINPDTGAPVSANIAPAMFALLAAAAFAFGKRK